VLVVGRDAAEALRSSRPEGLPMMSGRALLIVMLPRVADPGGRPGGGARRGGWRTRNAAVVQGYNEGRYRETVPLAEALFEEARASSARRTRAR
jgi:hypothetical protein